MSTNHLFPFGRMIPLTFLSSYLLSASAGTTADRLPAAANVQLVSLKVNSLQQPISIDDTRCSFSWQVEALNGQRGVVTEGFELELDELLPGGTTAPVWRSGVVHSNKTQFIQWPGSCSSTPSQSASAQVLPPIACPQQQLSSDSDYTWRVRTFPGPSAWSAESFSTSLLEQSDWAQSQWVQSNGNVCVGVGVGVGVACGCHVACGVWV